MLGLLPVSFIMDTASGHSTDTAIISGNWIACHLLDVSAKTRNIKAWGKQMFTWCGILRGDYELDPKFKSFWTCSVRGLGLSYEVAGALKGFQGMCTPGSWTGCQRGPNVPVELISSTSKYQPWLA